MTPESRELRICGGLEVRDREEDDPPYFAIIHRDVGGPEMRDRHRHHDRNCWCAPIVMGPEDARRQVNKDQFDGLKRLH